jgi:hypothetical protein
LGTEGDRTCSGLWARIQIEAYATPVWVQDGTGPSALGQGSRPIVSNSPRKGVVPIVTPIPQRATGRGRLCSSPDRRIPRYDRESIFSANTAFRVRIYRWKKCSTQPRVDWMNLVSSILGSGCRRSGPDPLGCATPSPSEGSAPAKQGVECRPPIAYSPLPSAGTLRNVFENDSIRT